ncbi:MAG: phosphatase PAP2 family protein [Bacteroidetes bacterium]|nr:phosphatase PAP2 family protein [Bacteroidota bacterium]
MSVDSHKPHIQSTPPSLVALLLLIASASSFIALTSAMLLGNTQHIDEWVLRMLRDTADPATPRGPTLLFEIMYTITTLGHSLTLLAFVLLGAAWLYFLGDRGSLRLLLFVGFGGLIINLALKIGISRPRPSVVPMLGSYDAWSYPSGHAMMSLAILLAIAVLASRWVTRIHIRRLLYATALVLGVSIGCSRLYLGVHYPSDVLAGWLAGLAWVNACLLLNTLPFFRTIHSRSAARPAPPPSP